MSAPGAAVLATGGYDHSIRFWEANSGSCHRTLQYTDKQVNGLQISPDKTLLVTAGNPLIRTYDIPSQSSDPVISYEGHTNNVTAVGFQKEGRWIYSCSEDGTVKIWDLRAPGCQRDYECKAPVNTVALHPNQAELVCGDQKGTVRIWDLTASSSSSDMVPEGPVSIQSVAIAPDASVVVAANNKGNCYLWSPREGYTPMRSFAAHAGSYILRARISPDARFLATASSDKTIKLWSLPTMELKTTLTGHARWVWDCAFSDDSCFIVSASSDCTARLWEVATGDVVRTYTGHQRAIVAIALNDSPAS